MKSVKKFFVFTMIVLLSAGLLCPVKTEAKGNAPAKPVIKVKTFKSNTQIKITISKTKRAKGYRIFMKAPGETKYKKIKTLKKDGTKKRTYKVKNLRGGKYSFKVRAYAKRGGKTVWSKYSKVRTIKVVRTKTPVRIDEAHFPDEAFRNYVREDFDKDGDGYLNKEEITLIRNVHCENMNIRSLQGIEYFSDLRGLWCKGNHISKIDLSGNPELTGIWCSYNDFTSLDFSDCPKLEWAYCFNCKLKSLNIRNNPELAYLECNANPKLTKLDLSHNKKLENLFCSNCGLTKLDLSKNPMLCELAAFYNDLEKIDVSKNSNLKRLDIWHNPKLGNVDLNKLPQLQYYNCAWTALTKLDVSHNPELTELVCGYNKGLKSIDLSHNPKLAYFACECDINLKSLDLSHNKRLYYLLAFGLSRIDTIDISHNSRLCKAYQKGKYVHETENLGNVYSKTIDYGGSGDPFDQLQHCVCFDDDTKIIGEYKDPEDVPDSVVDKSDGYPDSEAFVTRAEAVSALYEAAGSPAVKGASRFTDVVAGASYEKAVKWCEDHKICFGYPNISSDTFCPDELISRQDFALMAHRYAGIMKFGTAFDYGRTDWFKDFTDIDFYAWGHLPGRSSGTC